MATTDKDDGLEQVDPSRRAFLKGFIATTAFAVPVVSSFAMDGVAEASPEHQLRNQSMGNQRGGDRDSLLKLLRQIFGNLFG